MQTHKKTNIDSLSVGVVHPLKMMKDEKCIAVGTGFFYLYNEKFFLVTAAHNFTGKNHETNEVFGIPEKVQIMLYNIKDGMWASCSWNTHEIDLIDSNANPLWLEHPQHGAAVDVVAISVELPEEQKPRPINQIALDHTLPISVGMDVFILGYPHGYSSYPTIAPIWKRGSLATEFNIDIGRKPKMYIDSATAKGMSGSLIIAQQAGYYPEGQEGNLLSYVYGRGRRFLGIYTGRYTDKVTADIHSDIFNAQLGIAWKASVIEEILVGQKKGAL